MGFALPTYSPIRTVLNFLRGRVSWTQQRQRAAVAVNTVAVASHACKERASFGRKVMFALAKPLNSSKSAVSVDTTKAHTFKLLMLMYVVH